ncbi:MAG: hypothetical protein MI785_14950 [Kiloniellales bacterium]|nr:hypothetical protein [Kiloniellales bacterium]
MSSGYYGPAHEILSQDEFAALRSCADKALLILLDRAGGEIALTSDELDKAHAAFQLAFDLDDGRLVLRTMRKP